MSNSNATDARAWRADTVGEPASWYHALSESALAEFERFLPVAGLVTELRPDQRLRDAVAADIGPIRDALETGRGFVVITAGATGRYSPRELTAIYWLLGSLLGRPIEQNVQGTLLYDVKDTGQDVRYGARFSVTNSESSFHTDSSFMEVVTDYVGLLCLNEAKAGGLSQIVSGYAVRETLLAGERKVWEQLNQPFHVDRRGGVRPGEEPTVRYPVFSENARGVLIRYLRYWIEAGHEKAAVLLTTEQIAALDTLDRVAADTRLRVEFALRPGEMFFVNNRWILHNRTAFEDHAEPDRRRHLLRLWVSA
ncbi:MAG: TauD/TfdA family dioxygenase [Planctomycetes bacterium]|nr:TauD/TfdA family dioxygenase [Planctomycetota bacterium]